MNNAAKPSSHQHHRNKNTNNIKAAAKTPASALAVDAKQKRMNRKANRRAKQQEVRGDFFCNDICVTKCFSAHAP